MHWIPLINIIHELKLHVFSQLISTSVTLIRSYQGKSLYQCFFDFILLCFFLSSFLYIFRLPCFFLCFFSLFCSLLVSFFLSFFLLYCLYICNMCTGGWLVVSISKSIITDRVHSSVSRYQCIPAPQQNETRTFSNNHNKSPLAWISIDTRAEIHNIYSFIHRQSFSFFIIVFIFPFFRSATLCVYSKSLLFVS